MQYAKSHDPVNKGLKLLDLLDFGGAPGRTRTADPLITNQVLYQLSYKGMGAPIA